jgi:phosphoribosylformylglycinamidine synthase
VVATVPGAEADFAALCSSHGVPSAELGVTGGTTLEVVDCFTIPLDELAAAHRGTLPALFG